MQNRKAISILEAVLLLAAGLTIALLVALAVRARATSHATAGGRSVEVRFNILTPARSSSTLISAFPGARGAGNFQITAEKQYRVEYDYRVDPFVQSVKARYLIQLDGTSLKPVEVTLPISSTVVDIPVGSAFTAHALLKPGSP